MISQPPKLLTYQCPHEEEARTFSWTGWDGLRNTQYHYECRVCKSTIVLSERQLETLVNPCQEPILTEESLEIIRRCGR